MISVSTPIVKPKLELTKTNYVFEPECCLTFSKKKSNNSGPIFSLYLAQICFIAVLKASLSSGVKFTTWTLFFWQYSSTESPDCGSFLCSSALTSRFTFSPRAAPSRKIFCCSGVSLFQKSGLTITIHSVKI